MTTDQPPADVERVFRTGSYGVDVQLTLADGGEEDGTILLEILEVTTTDPATGAPITTWEIDDPTGILVCEVEDDGELRDDEDPKVDNTDEVRLGYAACNIAWRPTIETNYGNDLTHYGPIVKFRCRAEGNAAYGQVYSKDLLESDEGTLYSYHWAGNSTCNGYDWNIAILGGRSADRFDFGFAGQNQGW